jgi:hypothetical protein
MTSKASLLGLALLSLALPFGIQNTATGLQAAFSDAAFIGVWRGQLEGLPAVDIVISNEGGQLTGGILFYFHVRVDVNHAWTSTPGLPEPMFNIRIQGDALHFQVSHRRAHPPRTLNDPPVSFKLAILGHNKAELVNETESSPSPPVALVRSDY